MNSKSKSSTINSNSTTTSKSTSSTSRKVNNETSDLSLSEQSSFTTSPQTERKTAADSKPNAFSNSPQHYYRNSASTKSGTLSSNYSTNQSSQNSSIGFVWKPNSAQNCGGQSPRESQVTNSVVIGDKIDKPAGTQSFSNDNLDTNKHNIDQNQPKDLSEKQTRPQNHVNQLVNSFNKMFPQSLPVKSESKNMAGQRLENDSPYSQKNDKSQSPRDNSLIDRVANTSTQRKLSNGLSDSWGNSMQRSNGRAVPDDDDTYYDTKYGKYGSLGRKESMGRYRKYQPTKSSSGVITFGSPRLMQRSAAMKMPLNIQQPDNLFTDTGSPKYVNTSVILGQQPHHKPSNQPPQHNNALVSQPQVTHSPVVGRRGLQQEGSQRDNYGKHVVKNLGKDFSQYGNDVNSRLHPVTTIQQVLYNNGNQITSTSSNAAAYPPLPNGFDQGQSPIQQLHPTSAMVNSTDNALSRSEVTHSHQRFPSTGVGMHVGSNPGLNHNSSSSSSTSSNFIPPLQTSADSQNISQVTRSGGDRIILERNLEKLITQKGLEVLGQLTAEMTQDQIERLLHKTKEKLGTHPTGNPTGSPSDFGNFESAEASRSRRPLDIDFTRNHDLDGYLSQQLQLAPAPKTGITRGINSHQRYGSQTSCPSWAQEGDSYNPNHNGGKTKSPDLNNLKFMPHQEMNGRGGGDESSDEDDDNNVSKSRKGNLVNGNHHYQGPPNVMSKKHHNKHRHDRLNASFHGEGIGAKNLSVRFDQGSEHGMANQHNTRPPYPNYPSSPYIEQRSHHLPPQGYPHSHHQRSHSTSHHHHHRHHRDHKPFHQRSASSSRQQQTTSTQHLQQHFKEDSHDGSQGHNTSYNHQPISRSHSYSSGQAGFANAIEQQRGGGYPHPQQHGHHRNQSPSMMMPSAMRGQTPNTKRKHGRNVAFHDDEDGRCPTCSSDSSSDSDDDPYAYQPAPRKAYGGVRLAYVPNDRRRAKLMSDPRLEYVPRNVHGGQKQQQMNHPVRAGSLQPQSLPPSNSQQMQHSQQQYHQPHHQQQNGGRFHQQQNSSQHKQQHPLQTHQQQTPYFPSQPGHHRAHPQNVSPAQSGGDGKDKDKNCVIQ